MICRIFVCIFLFVFFISCNKEYPERSISIPSKVDTSYQFYISDSIFTYYNSNKRNGKALIYIHGCPSGKHNHRTCLLNTPVYNELINCLV